MQVLLQLQVMGNKFMRLLLRHQRCHHAGHAKRNFNLIKQRLYGISWDEVVWPLKHCTVYRPSNTRAVISTGDQWIWFILVGRLQCGSLFFNFKYIFVSTGGRFILAVPCGVFFFFKILVMVSTGG